MNIFKKTSIFLLLTVVIYSPLRAQKKLALANECFNSKAYYLASRYYQEFFGQMNDCHPDQLKMAQSLAATRQLVAAESVFHSYMNCQKDNPAAYLAYGKFLMDIQAYEKAIPYFEKAMEAEPQLASHYMLVCRTALPKPPEAEATSIFVNQVTARPNESQTSVLSDEPSNMISVHKTPLSSPVNTSNQEDAPIPIQISQTTSATEEINLYDAMVSADKEVKREEVSKNPSKKAITNGAPKSLIVAKATSEAVAVPQKMSPYGVRLGTYNNTTIPDLSSIQAYGTIEQKQWKGKTILFLVDFSSREAAEAAVTIARQNKFRSATLVEKLASGRMKSVK